MKYHNGIVRPGAVSLAVAALFFKVLLSERAPLIRVPFLFD